MKLFKNYKKLYNDELENRKKLITQNSNLSKENVEYQKQIKMYKEKCARLTCDLEDIDNLLKVETNRNEVAKKEITKLKRENKKLKNILYASEENKEVEKDEG